MNSKTSQSLKRKPYRKLQAAIRKQVKVDSAGPYMEFLYLLRSSFGSEGKTAILILKC
jgi:hypothetical protein